jgi:Spy/CpxP family protein refolding chaperone
MTHTSSVIGRRAIALLIAALVFAPCSRADAAGGMPSEVGRDSDGGPRFGGPPPMFRLPPPEVLESLGLSEAQRTQIERIHDEGVRTTARTEADLTVAELDLRRAVEADKPDRAAVDAAIERVASLRTSLFKARVASWIDVRAVLTPAQRSKLRTLGPPGRPPR